MCKSTMRGAGLVRDGGLSGRGRKEASLRYN